MAIFDRLHQYKKESKEQKKQITIQIKELEKEQNILVDCLLKVSDETAIQKIETKLSNTKTQIDKLKEIFRASENTIDTEKLKE